VGFLSDHWASEERLTELLRARPDFDNPPLRSLADLDYRSRSDPWYSNGMMHLDIASWALVQASCLSEPQASLQHLADLIGDPLTIADVTEAAATLQRLGMAVVGHGTMLLDPRMRSSIEGAGGLGPPAAELMDQQSVDVLRRIVERLGGTVRSTRKADLVAQVLSILDDTPTILRAIDALPSHATALLQHLAFGSAYTPQPDWYNPASTPMSSIQHLAAIGIVLPAQRQHWVLIREVSLLLRGGRHILLPPQPTLRNADDVAAEEAAALAERSALAAATVLSDIARLCTLVERSPLSCLQSGGVGAAQIKKVAKELGLEPTRVADIIDAAAMAGLIDVQRPTVNSRRRQPPQPGTVVIGGVYNIWRSQSLAEQWCHLVESWYFGTLTVGFSMRPDPDRDNKIDPAMWTRLDRYAVSARQRLADLLRSGRVAPRLDRGSWFAWFQPWIRSADIDFDEGIAAEIDFLELLGVCSDGFVHEAARAILTDLSTPGSRPDTTAAVIESVQAWLGTNTSVLTVQGDMTMIITGHAPAELTSELLLMADVVSQGHATVYRICDASLHRAFEYGRTATGLIELLTEYGSTTLPNAVATLFADAERRFGRFRVSSPASVIVVADALAAAELLSSRNAKVKSLGLTQLAETVFASIEPMNVVVSTLKEAGMAATSTLPRSAEPAPDMTPAKPSKGGGKKASKATANPMVTLQYRRQRPPSGGRAADEIARQLLAAPPAGGTSIVGVPQTSPSDEFELLLMLRDAMEVGESLNILYLKPNGDGGTVFGTVTKIVGRTVEVTDERGRSKLIPLDLIIATSDDQDDTFEFVLDDEALELDLDFDGGLDFGDGFR
jgi:Helicase conserved C-terminal domain